MRLHHHPQGLSKVAAQLEQLDKTALSVARAAGYGGLAGLGLYGARKLTAAATGQPDPSDYGDSAVNSTAKNAVGGAAVAALLNFLGRVAQKR